MKKINVGIIGLGYWGPNLYRNFDSNNNINIIAVADLDKKKFTPTSVANGIDGLSYYYDPGAIDKGLRYNNNSTGTYMPRSYYEDEYEKNEERRKIKVIRPEFIRRVVSEFERIMSA